METRSAPLSGAVEGDRRDLAGSLTLHFRAQVNAAVRSSNSCGVLPVNSTVC